MDPQSAVNALGQPWWARNPQSGLSPDQTVSALQTGGEIDPITGLTPQQSQGGLQSLPWDKLGDFAKGGLYEVAKNSGVQLPQAVHSVGQFMQNPEVNQAMGLLGTFGGVGAKTADMAKLAKAQEMHAGDAYPSDIWDATGWFRGVDDKWRFEIPDIGARASSGGRTDLNAGKPQTASQFLWHKPLYDAYPELRQYKITGEVPEWAGGVQYPGQNTIGIKPGMLGEDRNRSIALHEMQHAIQEKEGFAYGSNPRMFETPLKNYKNRMDGLAAHDALEAWHEQNPSKTPSVADIQEMHKTLWGKDDLSPEAVHLAMNVKRDILQRAVDTDYARFGALPGETKAEDVYHRTAGEVEARNVQKRRNMTLEELMALPPMYSEDVPSNRQLFK